MRSGWIAWRSVLLFVFFMSSVDSLSTAESTPMLRRGAFFLFEGLDRAGKSSQAARLAESLSKRSPAELIRYPDRTTAVGSLIGSYLTSSQELNDHSIHLLFSANRWEQCASVERKLSSGTHLVSLPPSRFNPAD